MQKIFLNNKIAKTTIFQKNTAVTQIAQSNVGLLFPEKRHFCSFFPVFRINHHGWEKF